RRHTRFSRDWSSDVCSSDLTGAGAANGLPAGSRRARWPETAMGVGGGAPARYRCAALQLSPDGIGAAAVHAGPSDVFAVSRAGRSEERRVGKEWRAGGTQGK